MSLDAIFNRRSVRKFTDEKLTDEQITALLKAAMHAPSARNFRPWEFIVVTDKEKMKEIMKVHQYSQMLEEAACAIIVCANDEKKYMDYWIQDCSAATENILIAATELGLGSVWLGIYPDEQRMNGIKKIFNIPKNFTPVSGVAIGYAANKIPALDKFDSSMIHYEQW